VASERSPGIASSSIMLHTSIIACSTSRYHAPRSSCWRVIYFIFSFCSVKMWKALSSMPQNSRVTPSCSRYNISLDRGARFNSQLPSSPVAASRTKSVGNGRMCGMCVLTICLVMAMSSVGSWVTYPRGHSCKACKCALITPNTVVCMVISSANVLVVTLLASWLLSMNLFSRAFVVLDFFRICREWPCLGNAIPEAMFPILCKWHHLL